jgi:predicted RecB family nuclease
LLSKSKFVGGWQCEKQAYLNAHHPKLAKPFDSATLARFASGTRFGELARRVWPEGVFVNSPAFRHDAAVEWTRDLVDGDSTDVIFEAGFTAIGTRVRADVMIRDRESGTWDLVEVKSSSSPKPVHDVDMAIQRAVLEASGVSVGKTSVMLVNSDYVRSVNGIDPNGLFKIVDRTNEVAKLLDGVTALNDHLHQIIALDTVPEIEVGTHCEDPYECPFFAHCTKDRPIDWVKTLPGFGLKKTSEFEERGIFGISEISEDEKLNALQNRAVHSSRSGMPWISSHLSKVLAETDYPLRFIDFETASPAVPLYPGTSPRELLPFQWSCHTLKADGTIDHADYLAGGESDPRREFVESLLRAVGTDGPVLVYSSYEQSTLRKLVDLYPDLAQSIERLISRFVDMLNLVRENYYHPAFKGSFSIKGVLPVVVPGFDYSDLEIGEGETASATFVDIVEGRVGEDELDDVLTDLLEYCKRDTEAMVRIWQRLELIAQNRQS